MPLTPSRPLVGPPSQPYLLATVPGHVPSHSRLDPDDLPNARACPTVRDIERQRVHILIFIIVAVAVFIVCLSDHDRGGPDESRAGNRGAHAIGSDADERPVTGKTLA